MAALPELSELVLMKSTKAQEEVILRRVQATPWSRGKDLDVRSPFATEKLT